MNKTIKKALSIILTMCLAVSCFAVNAFGVSATYTGYDHNGRNTALTSNFSFTKVSQDDTELTVDVVVDHMSTKLYGFYGTLVFDSTLLQFESVSYNSNYVGNSALAAQQSPISLSDLTAGVGGSVLNKNLFATYTGGSSALSTSNLAGVTIQGEPSASFTAVEEDSTTVATVKFKVIGSGKTALTALSSYIYSANSGYYNLSATTTADDVKFATSYSAVTPFEFEATGTSADVKYYNIDFTYYDVNESANTTVAVKTKENEIPAAPSPENYVDPADGDYDMVFTGWNSEVAAATADASYTAQYDRTFVKADYTAYDSAVSAANAALANADRYTDDSVANLRSALTANTVSDNLGRTSQNTVSDAASAIQAAVNALEDKPVVTDVTVTFVYDTADGQKSETVTVAPGTVPTAPAVSGYSSGDYDYTFKSWDKEVAAATADTTYTAVFEETFVAADTSALEAAVNAANTEIAKDIYTAQSVETLEALINSVKDTYGRTEQTVVDSLKDSIEAATQALTEQKYTVTFVYKDAQGKDTSSTQEVVRHGAVTAPTGLPQYSDGVNTYSFSKWDSALSTDVTSALTYTAQYTTTANPADFTKYNAAVQAANAKIGTGKYADDSAMAALKALLAQDTSSFDASSQSELDALADNITSAAAALNYKVYTITFVYGSASGEVRTPVEATIDTVPTAPVAGDYSAGDYDYTFKGWDKTIVAATENATYTATYDSKFVPADYTAYNAAVSAANAAIEADTYTDATISTLKSVLAANTLSTELGRTSQDTITTAASAISAATDSLSLQYYTVTFKYKDSTGADKTDTQQVLRHSAPAAPSPESYVDGAYTMVFQGWTPAVATDTVANVEYTATYKNSENAADFSKYTQAVNAAQAEINKGIYTDDSVAALQALLDTDVSDWGASKQAELDKLAADITAATAALEEKGADYSKWDEAVKSIPADLETAYKSAGVAAVKAAQADAPQAGLKITQQSVVDAKTAALNEAISALVAREDNSQLKAAYDALKSYTADTEANTPASVEAFAAAKAEALASAEDVLSNVDATSEQIAEAVTKIEQAYDVLVAKADVTKLAEALTNALTKDTSSFTPDSVTAYNAEIKRISDAYAAFTGNETQADVDALTKAVADADALLVAQADKGALKDLIDSANALDSTLYVDFSAVSSAIANAQSVYDNSNASDAQVSAAITSLNTALNALVFKDADYTQWFAAADEFNALDKTVYTESSVKACEDVLAKVVLNKDINYQSELNSLTEELKSAINALQFITVWEGETDWEGTVFDTFGSNTELSVENLTNAGGSLESGDKIKVTVTVNHPNYDIAAIQEAILYDADLFTFTGAEATDGTVLYSNSGAAQFNPADYGIVAMKTPSIAKVAAEYNTVKPAQSGVRDEVMVLYFTVKGAASGSADTVMVNVPLASNITEDASNYSEIITSNGDSEYSHRTPVEITVGTKVVTGVTVSGSITATNSNIETVITLKNDSNEYTTTVESKAGSGTFGADYALSEVEPGTYTMTFVKAGSLTYTINNVVVTDSDLVIGGVELLAGDVNGDQVIDSADITELLSESIFAVNTSPADVHNVNGDGVVDSLDITIIALETNFAKNVYDCTVEFGA